MQSQPTANLSAGFKNNLMPPAATVPIIIPEVADTNVFSIFGQSIQKKYIYIVLFLVLLLVAYLIWKWYNKKGGKNKNNDSESFEDDDEEFSGYPPNQNNPNSPNPQVIHDMNQHLMAQVSQQQMLINQLKERLNNLENQELKD
jgi:hypothetical protein